MTYARTLPRLVVLEPPALRGQLISLAEGWTTVGQGQVNMRLNEPGVSPVHAGLCAADGQVTVEDLGSVAGTTLNGHQVRSREALRSGDVLGFGPVRARYETAPTTAAENARPPAGQPSFTIRDQTGQVSNVGRDQYNAYLQTVVTQRDSFFREIAAARTRARRIVTFGLILFLGGTAVGIVALILYERQLGSANIDTDPHSLFKNFDIAFIASGVSAFGLILVIVGIVLHVVATSRRRRVDETLPIRPPS